MKVFLRFLNMAIGLILTALGIIITIKANIGYAPWDVFHFVTSLFKNGL